MILHFKNPKDVNSVSCKKRKASLSGVRNLKVFVLFKDIKE
jgi:hypothetical protein